MASIHPSIKPNGIPQRELVNLICMILRSLQGICQKLDADAGVTDTTYEANCITALINLSVTDSLGNRFSVGSAGSSTIEQHHVISATGISGPALLAFLYQVTNAFETLCEQLDADGGVTDTDHEALCYTVKFLHLIENERGNQLGNGTAYYFRPGGMINDDELVDWLYNCVDAIETLTEQLDAGAGVTDTDYEALWFTAVIVMRIENGAGNVVGNDETYFG